MLRNYSRKAIILSILIIITLLTLPYSFYVKHHQVAEAATSFRFVVMGDSRGESSGINETTLRKLLGNIKGLSKQPSFVLFTGDQIYGGSNIESEHKQWKQIVDDYYPMNTYYPTLGNHERDETLFSQAFPHLPGNQLAGYQRSSYFFDYGNARFIVLNSQRQDANGKHVIDKNQRNWLESLLKNNGKMHNYVMFHIPAYPVGPHYGRSLDGNPSERDALWNILDKYKVSAVFVGHEHTYNRRLVDHTFGGNGFTFEHNLYQLTLGGAGAPLYDKQTDTRNMKSSKNAYHYMVVDVEDKVSSFKVYDINNNVIDSFTVESTGSTPTSTVKSFQNGVFPTSDYSETKDTTLSESQPTASFGSTDILSVDGSDPYPTTHDLRTLIKWDISNIPAGSKIQSAAIQIHVTNHSSGQPYRLYQLKRNFYESTATWSRYSLSYLWKKPGGDSIYDRSSTSVGALAPNTTGSYSTPLNEDGIALIQAWIDGKTKNYGFLISNSENTDGLDFYSSEAANPSLRPKLSVTYSK